MKLKTRRVRRLDWRRMFSGSGRPVDEVQSGSLATIDDAIGRFVSRRLVPSGEVVDLLLDVRSAVASDAAFTALLAEMEKR